MKIIRVFALFILLLFVFFSCTERKKSGKELAAVYCQSCHLLPSPQLLDKNTWRNGVLPNMGRRLGFQPPPSFDYTSNGEEDAVYPTTPVISNEEWQKIKDYYLAQAPEKPLPQPPKPVVQNGMPGFSVITYTGQNPLTTAIHIDTQNAVIYTGDIRGNVFQYTNAFRPIDSITLRNPVSDIYADSEGVKVLGMGVSRPSDNPLGKLFFLEKNQPWRTAKVETVLADQNRPVQFSFADMDGDGKKDIIDCNFGNNRGTLSLFKNLGNHQYKEFVLKSTAGARKTVVQDMNGDGRSDVVALFSQAREGISIFYNKGNDQFEEKVVLQFPPVYGTTYFELADFNHDGAPDLVVSSGDNADYSNILKSYHGIRIYLNDGKNNFTEKYFYPFYGAFWTETKDYDGDGNLDIACVSFFPDYKGKTESFVYLQNKGNLSFTPFTFPQQNAGRWLVMASGDIDKDGDEDIVLGSFLMFVNEISAARKDSMLQQKIAFIVLRNNSQNKGKPTALKK